MNVICKRLRFMGRDIIFFLENKHNPLHDNQSLSGQSINIK